MGTEILMDQWVPGGTKGLEIGGCGHGAVYWEKMENWKSGTLEKKEKGLGLSPGGSG